MSVERRPGDVRAMALLDALYRELPTLACQQKCQSCCGPIEMTRVEWGRIVKKLGYEPRLPLPRTQAELSRPGALDCPMLRSGLCSVYGMRPLICRLWGVIETMPCPWGCQPQPGYLTVAEGYDLMLRAEAISDPERVEEIARLRQLLRDEPERVAWTKLFHEQPVLVETEERESR